MAWKGGSKAGQLHGLLLLVTHGNGVWRSLEDAAREELRHHSALRDVWD